MPLPFSRCCFGWCCFLSPLCVVLLGLLLLLELLFSPFGWRCLPRVSFWDGDVSLRPFFCVVLPSSSCGWCCLLLSLPLGGDASHDIHQSTLHNIISILLHFNFLQLEFGWRRPGNTQNDHQHKGRRMKRHPQGKEGIRGRASQDRRCSRSILRCWCWFKVVLHRRC